MESEMQKWEYSQFNHTIEGKYPSTKFFEYNSDKIVNVEEVKLWSFIAKLGEEGWELVSYVRLLPDTETNEGKEFWVFKRPIP
jgi:hypothetical protein